MAKIPAIGSTVEIDDQNKKYLGKEFTNDTTFKVVDYDITFYGRVVGFGKSGIYINEHWAIVESKSGQQATISTIHLKEIVGTTVMMDRRSMQERRIGDLPTTKFFEWDIVKDKSGHVFRIDHINYSSIGQFTNDGVTPMPIYTGSSSERPFQTSLNESDLTLVERGNVWKKENGEELSFSSTEEEIGFYLSIAEADEMPNPRRDDYRYRWTDNEALASIKEGYADYSPDRPSISVYKFHAPEIGKMAREFWLAKNDPDHSSDSAPQP